MPVQVPVQTFFIHDDIFDTKVVSFSKVTQFVQQIKVLALGIRENVGTSVAGIKALLNDTKVAAREQN